MTDAEIIKAILTKIGPEKIAMMAPVTYGSVIFSHEFAKALWGESYHQVEAKALYSTPWDIYDDLQLYQYPKAWQYHLQQMVLEDNPVKYLEKFI